MDAFKRFVYWFGFHCPVVWVGSIKTIMSITNIALSNPMSRVNIDKNGLVFIKWNNANCAEL